MPNKTGCETPGVLFISDGSINNPILKSQGIPLMEYLSSQQFRSFILSFEDTSTINSKNIAEKFCNIHFIKIALSNDFIPDWMKMIILGTISTHKIINQYSIRILHTRSFTPALVALIIKKFFFREIGFLYDNRGLFIDEQIYIGKWKEKGVKAKIAKYLEKKILESSDKIVIVSEKFKEYINIKYGLQFAKKLKVITNRTEIFPLPEHKKDHTYPIIGIFAGSGAKWQNVSELSQLLKVAYEHIGNIDFKIFSYEKDSFNKEKLHSKVNIYKLMPDEVKREMLKGDFGILLREKIPLNFVSAPLKFSEYLSCGLPVLCSEGIGDTEEIIDKYGVGVIVKNNNYLEALRNLIQILSDPGIKNKCHRVAEIEFNIINSFQDYKSIYQDIISG